MVLHKLIIVREEKSKSRTGKHAYVEKAFLVSKKGGITDAKGKIIGVDKTLYSTGYARKIALGNIDENTYVVRVRLVKGFKNIVKGEIIVLDNNGFEVYKAVYRRLKLRRSHGDPKYAWIVEAVAKHLRLPVKRINLR